MDNTGHYNLGNYDVSGNLVNPITYDKNGNITLLNRKGHTAVDGNGLVTGYGVMDDLTYTYDSGNKLTKVLDNGNDTYGFKDSSANNQDYWYDANGNLTSDANKGITLITYNHLNLPDEVRFGSTNKIKYIYDVTGVKLEKKVVESGNPDKYTYYAGNYVYEGSSLKFFNQPEGYVDAENGYDYVYQYKDHLGNVRLSYSDADNNGSINPSTEIIEENNYYPFGLEHKGYNNVVNGVENDFHTYQGQELEEELGKNTLAFQWRDYDPAIGRFNKVDRFAEKYADASPYSYITNNPISLREIKGDSILVHFKDKDGNKLSNVPDAVQKMFQNEFGITVGYNSETSMLYLSGEYDSELSQSEDATGMLVEALTDTNTGKNSDKHGTIIFGYNLKGIRNGTVDGGEWDRTPPAYKNGLTQIDLGDYDSNGKYEVFDYNKSLNSRSFNMARTFEHEYLGHQRLRTGGFGDGSGYSMGRIVESVNQFNRQRGIPERLNYNTNGYIFFGNTGDFSSKGAQRRAVRDMVNNPSTNNLHVKRKRRR